MKGIKLSDFGEHECWVVRDPRGESESYTAYTLECRTRSGLIRWHEGVLKDRTHMGPMYRDAFEAFLEVVKS